MKSFAVGVDLGGTNLRVAAYSHGSEFLETIQLPTRRESGREAILIELCGAIERLLARYSGQFQLEGVGIATPGPMELPEGRLLILPNLPDWNNFQLKNELEARLGTPILVENDANVAALAECKYGQGREYGVESLCMLTLGTGVGSGIILQGRVWHGMNGMAGEAGHIVVYPGGAQCGCGSLGCLEQYASATAVVRMAHERARQGDAPGITHLALKKPKFSSHDLFLLAKAGDVQALEVFAAVGRALGVSLASLVNTLNLELYVVGGGLASAWELFEPEMMNHLRQCSSIFRITDPDLGDGQRMAAAKTFIAPAKLGSDAGLLGACLLPFTVSVSSSLQAQNIA
jgi:glucokinase